MNALDKAMAAALESTEANGFVMGYCQAKNRIYVLPLWEAENKQEVEAVAFAQACRWADDNGMGDCVVQWAYREDHNGLAPE